MFFRQKTKLASPGEVSGPTFPSVLRDAWRAVFSRNPLEKPGYHALSFSNASLPASGRAGGAPSLERDFGKQQCPTDLHGVIDVLGIVRQRILTNTFLRGWTKWWTWVLIGLIVVAAISAKLTGAIALAAILVVAGTAMILTWIWRTRLSIYDAACRLDSAAALHDRVSTALFLADAKNPDEMMLCQRRDALARLGKVEPRGLFPIQMPVAASRALLLAFVAAGLLVYRINHKPPLVSLLQSTERSQLVQSILSPIVHAMERDLQRTMALVAKPETADEVRSGDTNPPPDDLWQNGDDKQNSPENGQQDAAEPGADDQQDQSQSASNQSGSESSESQQQQNGSQQSQENKSASSNSTNQSGQKQDSKSSENNTPSLGQSLMQALKDMMSNPQSQQSNSKGNQEPQQSNAQGSPQSGSANANNSNQSGQKGDSRGSSEAKQKPSQSTSNGAGSQAGLKQVRTDFDSHPVTAVPDRVALESTSYKEQIRMRATTEAGTSQMATHDVSPQALSVVNGAEQENIPARYRMYVQRYFEHTESGSLENAPQQSEPQPSGAPPAGTPENGSQ